MKEDRRDTNCVPFSELLLQIWRRLTTLLGTHNMSRLNWIPCRTNHAIKRSATKRLKEAIAWTALKTVEINKSNNNYIIIWNEFGTLTFQALVDLSLARTPRAESRAPVLRAKSNRTSTYTTNQLVGSLRKQIKINSDLICQLLQSHRKMSPSLTWGALKAPGTVHPFQWASKR